MSGLKNTAKRIGSFMTGKGYSTSDERRQKRETKRQEALNRIYQGAEMPDEEQIRRNARRKAAARRGSRVSTILTNQSDETLG